ncbi:MAG TPA: PP2C family protein-serine/threonine phosphatase, partial [Thermoanaerobaculia bacterium]|nr:PP2C family protein-serine/threonine phosphatase [Thermoanaerobaculia bacterium]
YALLTPAAGDLESVCAGHPFPLLRRGNGRVEELGRGGLPLGVRDELAPEPQATTLGPGDLLVLYTDGLAEALNAQADAFGYERIAALIRPGGAPQEVHDRILAAFDAHVGEEPLRDDLTLLVIAREGGPSPAAVRTADTAAKVAAMAAAITRGAGGTGESA